MNKNCLILSNPKDTDYYINFIKKAEISNLDILYDDFREVWNAKIVSDCEKKLINFKLKKLSSAYFFNKKYEILISTGDNPPLNFFYLIFIKLRLVKLYFFLERIIYKIDIKIRNLFKINHKEKKDFRQIDYKIGKERYLFPRGYDLKPLYPGISRLQTFNNFLCHGDIDQEIILANNNVKTHIIGYPRYDVMFNKKELLESLKKEFDIKNDKKIIFWLPTYRSSKVENPDEGIDNWINQVKKLSDNFNVIVRPHPDRVSSYPQIVEKLKSIGLYVDLDTTRSLVKIYKIVDFIMCEVSGPFFSAIYNKCKILILDHKNKKNIHHKLDSLINKYLHYYKVDIDKKNYKDLEDYFFDIKFWNSQEEISKELFKILYGNNNIHNYKKLFKKTKLNFDQ